MHGTDTRDYLRDEFLDRVRRAYRLAIASATPTRGMWSDIDERRANVHRALIADGNAALREVFVDPASTELYYGMDGLCASASPEPPENFVPAALGNFRGKQAEYQLDRLVSIMSSPLDRSIVEIGPGMGRLGYFARAAGMLDYTTIDLPLGMVGQACFLGRMLSQDLIWFDGEPPENSEYKIKLYGPGRLPDRRYAVAINIDSFVEMPAPDAFRYASWLTDHADRFFSINHEYRRNLFSVPDVMAFTGRATRLDRRDCQVWPRYFEEIYSFGKRGFVPLSLRRSAFVRYAYYRSRLRLAAAKVISVSGDDGRP